LVVTGNSSVRADAIRRIAGLPTGETFHPDALRRAAQRLRRTGAFRSVAVTEAEKPERNQTLTITADVEEELPRRFRFGAQVSSRTGLALTLGWLHRNLAGNAERLSIEGQIRNIGGTEDIDGRFSIRLDQPARLGPDDNVFLLADLERLSRPHFDLDRFRVGIGVTRDLGDGLSGALSLEAQVADADDAFGTRRFRTLSLPFRLTLDRRDVPQDATRGYFLEGELRPFAGLGGTASGIATALEARGYLPLGDAIVLAGRARLASVAGPAQQDVSPALLHFSGGADSVRGHPFQSLGIPAGTATAGGRSLFLATAELRARLTDSWALAGFYDFGLVDAASVPGTGSRSHAGAGIGVRYTAGGFGPIRLDLALPLAGDTEDGLQFYIGIGQAF
jgi:translocation and assembly module TamA